MNSLKKTDSLLIFTDRVSGLVVVDDVPDPGGPDEGVGGGAGRAVGRVGQAVQHDDVAAHEVPVAAVLAAAAHLKYVT